MFKELIELQKSGKITKKELAEKVSALKLPPFIAFFSLHSTWIVVLSMWLLSSFVTLSLFQFASQQSGLLGYGLLALVPIVFLVTFVLTGIFWAQLTKVGIVEGKFPRSANHPIYALRRIYGTAWTQIYYFKPLYSACLAIPLLKFLLFRGFGYRGSLDTTIYPDTWIRDLPLLNFKKSTYIANRSVVGTNLCLNDGSVLVGTCTANEGAMVGHLGIFGLGCILGAKSEVGVGAALGIRVRLGQSAQVQPRATVYHGCIIEDNSIVGAGAMVGAKCRLGAGLSIPSGMSVPPGTDLNSDEDIKSLFEKEGSELTKKGSALLKLLEEQLSHGTARQAAE